MTIIHSRDNSRYKRLQRIVQAKRPLSGGVQQLWLEGVHLCQSWLECFGLPDIVVTDNEQEAANAEVLSLLEQTQQQEHYSLSSGLFKNLSSVGQPQGIAFVVSIPALKAAGALVNSALLLDRVQDPGNLGTLLRTAAAAGMTHVYLSEGCAAAWSQKVLRSAQGAHFKLQIYEGVNLTELITQAEVDVFATSLTDAQSLYDTVIPEKAAWIVGNEGQGVASELLALATTRVFIPQSDSVESLNVAIAAAICLFEHRRQHIQAK